MDLGILKKKLSSYKTDGGYVKNVSSDLLIEILSAWESWTGSSAGFYSGLEINGKSGAKMIGEAKKLKREGVEIVWDNGKLIRFSQAIQHLS
jgi:hypothetical protein